MKVKIIFVKSAVVETCVYNKITLPLDVPEMQELNFEINGNEHYDSRT